MNYKNMISSGFTDIWEVAPGAAELRTLFAGHLCKNFQEIAVPQQGKFV